MILVTNIKLKKSNMALGRESFAKATGIKKLFLIKAATIFLFFKNVNYAIQTVFDKIHIKAEAVKLNKMGLQI